MRTLHLFTGGGGAVLAGHLLGHTPVAFCEIEPACRTLLKKRYPHVPCFEDITTLTGDMVREAVGEIDHLEGGSPCQGVSVAGKNAGFHDDARSSLIWHQLRLTKELRPLYMSWENVPGALSGENRAAFDAFLFELAQAGYGGAWCILSAAQVGAPHQRKRVWLLAKRDTPGGFREISTKHMPAWPHPAAGQAWPTPRACKEEGFAGGIFRDSPMLGTEVLMSELWATARVSGAGTEDFVRDDGKLRDDLQTMAIMAECVASPGELWPTCRAQKTTHEDPLSWLARHDAGAVSTPPLDTACAMDEIAHASPSAWPTPTVQDGENAAGPSQFVRNSIPLNAEVFVQDEPFEDQLRRAMGGVRLQPNRHGNLPVSARERMEMFRELVRNMTPEQVRAIIGDRRLNPAWVENLMNWPIGWTDLTVDKPRVPTAANGAYIFPAGRWVEQKPHEPARITSVKARSPEAKARNAALKMLGNGKVPLCEAVAFRILFSALR